MAPRATVRPVPPVFVALIALVAVAGMAGAYLAWRAEQERLRALEALADELGLRFDPHEDEDHDEQYEQFAIFQRGHSRVATNTLHGSVELFGRACALRAGDFTYKETSGTGKSRSTRTYRFSYLIVHPPWATPGLLVRPEGIFDRIKGAFGFDDIDFESEEFSRRFWVQSPDKRFAYDVLHPRMIEFLLESEPPLLEVEHGALCISDGERRWDQAEFRKHAAFVRRFCELWPRHLVRELQS